MTNEKDSDSPTTDPKGQPPPPPPVIPPAPPQGEVGPDPDNGANNQQQTARELAREFRWVEVTSLIINGVLAVVGIVALCIYYGQLKVMRGQLGEIIRQYPELQTSAKAAKDAATAAGNSADTQTKAFHLDQRAWVMPFTSGTPSLVEGKEITIPFAITNNGKTPALAVDGDVAVGLLKKNELPEFVYKQHSGHPVYKIKGGIIFPGQPMTTTTTSYAVLEHGKEFIRRKAKPVILTQTLNEDLKNGDDLWIVVFGQLTYGDVFGSPHWTHFCWTASFPGTLGKAVQPGKHDCANYNDIDRNGLQSAIK